ncbi:hypothetical protein OXX79_003817, partial [Metschnikowia pulcherrima]
MTGDTVPSKKEAGYRASSPQAEIPPAVQAISNLRCPSPPPILTNSRTTACSTPKPSLASHGNAGTVSESVVSTMEPAARPAAPVTEKSSNVFSEKSSGSPALVVPGVEPGHTEYVQTVHIKESPLDVPLDFTSNPPSQSIHHKSPSVHAHFFVDETLKPTKAGNRSRSGSASASGSEYSAGPMKREDRLQSPPIVGAPEQNTNIDPRLPQDDGKLHILFGVCGAISTMKI